MHLIFTGPLHRWQHNCANLCFIPHLETLKSPSIPGCISVLAVIVTTTAALHHETWSRPAGQTDLYVAWISTEIQYELHTPSHGGKKHKWHKVEGNAFNTWLCCLQMCNTSVRDARSGATAHYRAWMKWHQGAIRSKSSSQFPEMPVIMLYFTKTLQMFQWRIQEKTGDNLRKELDINCTGIEKQPKVRPKSQTMESRNTTFM